MRDFVQAYADSICTHLQGISWRCVERFVEILLSSWREGSTVFIAGNGGSASTASHLACDLAKTTLGSSPREKERRLKAICLSDNVPLMTAWANDEGYDCVFSEQMKNLARPGDLLIVISASGNSPNILQALQTARELGMHTLGLLGFDGGKAKDHTEEHLLVPSYDYGQVEGVHSVVGHMITSLLCAHVPSSGRV